MKLWLRSSVTAFALAISTFSFADTIINHAQGKTKVSEAPSRVITFDIAALDTLDSLGVDVIGLPKKFVPDYLSKYRGHDYTNVGSLFEPDYEVVAAENPDFIVVGPRSARAYKSLNDMAPTVDMSISGKHFAEGFRQQVSALAQVFDKQDVADTKLKAIDAAIEKVRGLSAKSGNGLIILTNGGKISAYGDTSRFGWLHNELGIEPAVKDVKAATHGEPISFEFILKTNPDWLFVVDRDAALGKSTGAAKTLLNNDVIAQTKAYKQDQIVYLNGVTWYIVGSGLTAVQSMVDEVLLALQK